MMIPNSSTNMRAPSFGSTLGSSEQEGKWNWHFPHEIAPISEVRRVPLGRLFLRKNPFPKESGRIP